MAHPRVTLKIEPLIEVCRKCGTNLDVTALEPLTDVVCPTCGSTSQARVCLKHYKIVEVLGTGGMGSVFRARDLNLNRDVALKVVKREFSKDPKHARKFEEEARSTALVNHPNVVKVFASGADHGVLYIAMELAENGSLDDLMTAQGKIPEDQALEIGIQIAEGLRAAHTRGLIHRDVKPGNILFMADQTAKIVDFGLACLVNETGKSQGELWGTPDYIAPEKLNQAPEDFRSDIYSLGGTLFHAIAGRPPHEADTTSIATLKKIKGTTVKLQKFVPEISSASAGVINKMLQRDPAERYQTYAELVEELINARLALTPKKEVPLPVTTKKWLTPVVILWSVWFGVICIGLSSMAYVGNKKRKEIQAKVVEAARVKAALAAMPTPTPTPTPTPMRNIEEEYNQARRLLISGAYEKAGGLFAEMAGLPNLQQPLGRWIKLHQGMAALLARNQAQAKPIFQRLYEIGGFSLDPADKPLVNLFFESGRILSGDAPILSSSIKPQTSNGSEAMPLFLYALHDWQISQFDEAGNLFKMFMASNPAPPFDWIADYKPIAKKYLDDYAVYKSVTTRLSNATSFQLKIDALAELNGLKSPPLLAGPLFDKLVQLRDKLQQSVNAEKAEAEKKRLADLATELERQKQLLADVKLKVPKFLEEFRYDEALALIQESQITAKELQPDLNVLLKRAQWLQSFNATLLNDIATSEEYPQAMVKRSGAFVAGGLINGTKTQLEIKMQYGKMSVPWLEISPATILSMADYFSSKKARPEALPDRWWCEGVFAYQNGLPKQGLILMNKAIEKKPEYKEFLPMFAP